VHFSYGGGALEAAHDYLAVVGVSGSSPGFVPKDGLWLPLNIDPVTVLGLSLLDSPMLNGFAGQLDGSGAASFTLKLNPGQAGGLKGKTLTVAVVTLGPDGRVSSASTALDVALLP
jgi:hypothetical protein